jgi:putative acetyltransferase
MIEIRDIQPGEWREAKQLLYRLAYIVFEEPRPLEEVIAWQESRGWLKDMDDIQKNYFENGGVFLVITDDNRIIGTGGVRRLEDNVCELRRMWLVFEYQGNGLGYRLLMELLRNARELGYKKIRLETAPVHMKRAFVLYKSLGFYEIPKYESDHPDDVAMEMVL